jgi:hypothetical protein
METLRGQSPDMAQKEAYSRLIAHNLIRGILAQAAARHHAALERISFKGSLDARFFNRRSTRPANVRRSG